MTTKELFLERVSTAVAVACIRSSRSLYFDYSTAEWSSAFAAELRW
jgi:hypothetical protein